MLKLISILESLKAQPRLLNDEENLYLDQLGDEVRRAGSDAARWRILEREGLCRLEGFDFSEDVIAKLTEVRRAAMN
ncbi:MAG: hypothetical protein Q8O33_16050 [Pseudomonadota bacterium]|nr:hypothetical protein [Pseudomonadota bacterium]